MKKLLLFITIFIAFLFSANSQSVWTKLSPFPEIQHLYDNYFVDEQKGWVVGQGGIIQFTDDGGQTWETQHINETYDEKLNSVVFSGESEGWAVGWGQIIHTANAGQNWELQNRPIVFGDLTDVYFVDPDTGWIVGYYKIVLKTTDGGENWVKISNSTYSQQNFFSVYFTDAMHGCAVGGVDYFWDSCFIMVTEDGGDTWTETSPAGVSKLNDVYFLSQDTGYACGYDGNIIKTTDGGTTWTLIFEDYGFFPSNIYFFDSENGLAIGSNEYALTADGGENWTLHYMVNMLSITGFEAANDTVGYGVGPNGLLVKTTDRGHNWEQISDTIPLPYINGIGFFDELNGIKTAYNTLMTTNDGAYTWFEKEIDEEVKFKDLSLPNSDVGYILSNLNYKLLKTTNRGEDWVFLDLPVLSDQRDYTYMQFVNGLTGFICAENGYLYRTTDGGLTWNENSISTEPTFTGLFFVNENKGWLISEEGQVLRTLSGGSSFTFYNLQVNNIVYKPLAIFFVNEQLGYISTQQGAIFKTEDGGNNWDIVSEVSAGIYNSKLYFSDENTGWYKTRDKIYYTDDGGENWVRQQNYHNTALSDMFFLDSEHAWLCGQHNFVAKYGDPVSVTDRKTENEYLSISPNPANDRLFVSTIFPTDQIAQYEVYDMNGHLLIASDALQKRHNLVIDISKFNAGMYFLKVKMNGHFVISKFIKN